LGRSAADSSQYRQAAGAAAATEVLSVLASFNLVPAYGRFPPIAGLLIKDGADADVFGILSCLQTNRPKISKACNEVLASHGQ
jgi:hypothetical protein